MERLEARKAFRKMLKKSDIKKTLEQIEDYSEFYNDDSNNLGEGAQEESEDEEMEGVFQTEREKDFYDHGEDMEFVRFHKRTTRNFHDALQALIDSSKQTVAKGIQGQYGLTLSQVRLNKACTVANVFWTLNVLDPVLLSRGVREVQSLTQRRFIEEERKRRQLELQQLMQQQAP